MKIATFLGGAVLGCICLGVGCSSDEHQLGAEHGLQGTPHCEDYGKADGREDIRAYCVEFTYDSCPNGVWAAKFNDHGNGVVVQRWTCGDDVTLGCCIPELAGPRGGSCGLGYGGQCLPYSPDGCQNGRWLPRSAANCGEGQGCCAPTSCVYGHAGQCLPHLGNACPDGRWLPETVTDCAEGQSCCAPRPDGGL